MTAAPGAGGREVAGTTPSSVFSTVAEADHWIQSLSPAPELACTHLVHEPRPHVAVTLSAADGGRAVVFPGSADLVLAVRTAAGDRLVPFETRNPTACCAAH